MNNLLARDGAEDYTALAAQGAQMQEVAQGQQADNAQVPQGTASVSVQGSAGTSVSLAAPSLGAASATSGATLNGGIIVPQCTKHGLDTYYATYHLGTVRFVKTVDDNSGIVTTTTHDYEPFGVEITPADACDNTHKFTGHERDAETGNDYMHFRFFSASMGRFQKPDSNFDNPASNPQGWNLYSYVKGNPVNFNDPTGHAASVLDWAMSGDPMGFPMGSPDAHEFGGGSNNDAYNINFTQAGGTLPAPTNTMHDWINEWGRNLNQAIIALQGVLAEPPTPAAMPDGTFFAKEVHPPNWSLWLGFIKEFYSSFLAISQELDIDVDLLVSLSSLESGWCDTHNRELHNLWGLTKAGHNNLSFKSFEEGNEYWMHGGRWKWGERLKGSHTVKDFLWGKKGLLGETLPHYNSATSDWDKRYINRYNEWMGEKAAVLAALGFVGL